MKILFVDCDGSIREPLSGEKFAKHPRDYKIIEGADRAIEHFYNKRYKVVGITNQGGVASEYKSIDDCIEEQKYTLELFPQLDSILFCPDYEGESCWRVYRQSAFNVSDRFTPLKGTYRKPGSGMLDYFLIISNSRSYDILMVGDREEDKKAAAKIKARSVEFYYAKEWREKYGFN